MSDSMTYNQWVLQMLRNRGYDDSQIAQMLGASRTTVNLIINGKRSGRNIAQKIRKLAEASNFTSEEMGTVGMRIEGVTRIPATMSIKAPPEPTTLLGKAKEVAKEFPGAIQRMAQAKLITDRNERKEEKKQRQHSTLQEPPLPKASKIRPGDIVEIDARTGRPKRNPRTSQSSKLWKRADKLASRYPSTNQMVRQLMGADTPETPDTEEQESLIKLKALPDGRRYIQFGIAGQSEPSRCINCQKKPGTVLLPFGQGSICPECSRNHSSDPRVYR